MEDHVRGILISRLRLVLAYVAVAIGAAALLRARMPGASSPDRLAFVALGAGLTGFLAGIRCRQDRGWPRLLAWPATLLALLLVTGLAAETVWRMAAGLRAAPSLEIPRAGSSVP